MSSVPPGSSPLRLPLGEIVFYPTGRPSIRSLAREIAALGYEVSVFPLSPHTDLRPLTPGVWHCAVVISDIILFIVAPTAQSPLESSSDQSAYESSHNEPDSDNFDPDDFPPELDSDQNSDPSPNEFDSDNVDPEFPEDGYCHS